MSQAMPQTAVTMKATTTHRNMPEYGLGVLTCQSPIADDDPVC
ncbi:hypothetical protein [Methyloligella solikamskensis]|uniref:Uncharacterized protein n=1 Tax=Methyloligella solikamskensis TaxID=1177756 RepID=A0ABW3JBY5_9HYPH